MTSLNLSHTASLVDLFYGYWTFRLVCAGIMVKQPLLLPCEFGKELPDFASGRSVASQLSSVHREEHASLEQCRFWSIITASVFRYIFRTESFKCLYNSSIFFVDLILQRRPFPSALIVSCNG